jgi:hypothetical protein
VPSAVNPVVSNLRQRASAFALPNAADGQVNGMLLVVSEYGSLEAGEANEKFRP